MILEQDEEDEEESFDYNTHKRIQKKYRDRANS